MSFVGDPVSLAILLRRQVVQSLAHRVADIIRVKQGLSYQKTQENID